MSKGKIIQNRDRTNTVLETKNIEVEEVPCRIEYPLLTGHVRPVLFVITKKNPEKSIDNDFECNIFVCTL